jgi:hypothetical protein
MGIPFSQAKDLSILRIYPRRGSFDDGPTLHGLVRRPQRFTAVGALPIYLSTLSRDL